MIRSMTGFGTAEKATGQWLLRVEVRSVNRKDLHVSFRLPESFRLKESELQKLIENKLHRGQVYLSVSCESRAGESPALLNTERLRGYLRGLKQVAAEEDVPVQIDLANLLRLPEAIRDVETETELRDALWEDVVAVTETAVDRLVGMRRAEGRNLARQLGELCETIEELVAGMEELQQGFVEQYRDRLRKRIDALLEDAEVAVDEAVLAREAAVYADRSDVSEEITRLRSHLEQFRAGLREAEEPVGRKMEFIGQEMLREANTIASKAPAGEDVGEMIELKSAIDRLREQVSNVE